MIATSLPGLIGLAPPAANAPPGAAPPGDAAGHGVFAGVMAAAQAATGVPGGGTPTTGEPPTLDLAQLLSGFLPVVGESGDAHAEGMATHLEQLLESFRPDRLAGVERDETTSVREAYEALMSVFVGQAPVTMPDGVVRALSGAADAVALKHALATAAGQATTSELAQAFRATGATATASGLDGLAVAAGGDQQSAIALATAAATTQPSSTATSAAANAAAAAATATAAAAQPGERPLASLDVLALDADPARLPAQPTAASGTEAAASTFTTRLERAGAETFGGAGRADTPELGLDEPVLARPTDRGVQSQVMSGGTAPAPTVAEVAGVDAPVPTARPAELVARLAETVERATLTGNNELRLVLNPPELGHVSVRVRETAQGMRIAIDASSAAARELIQQHLPALHSALEARDLRVERLHVGQSEPSLGEQSLSQQRDGSAFQGGARQGADQGDRPTWSPVAAIGRGGTRSGSESRGGSAAVAERTRTVASAPAGRVDLLA